jgi:S1-C subfamily serine protease
MKMWKVILPVTAMLLLSGQAAAQTVEEQRLHEMEAREAEMEQRLREAEAQMEEAARTIAEITQERLPPMARIEQRYAMASKPRLGVTIETTDIEGPVEGVTILGVSPGSAASESGLRSGDILTSINDEALNAESCKEANMRLLDFMEGVEEGDVLTVEYLREGKVGSVEIEPRIVAESAFIWKGTDGLRSMSMPAVPLPPAAVESFKMEFALPWVNTGLGELELVELNEGLGHYFGTDQGLLVVSAPNSDAFDLRDGDVIQSIDGRTPKDTRHALRILSSYQSGEKLELGIMRDKKKMTIDVEIPADHHGNLQEGWELGSWDVEVSPAAAAGAPLAPAPAVEPVRALEKVIVIDIST